VIDQPGIDTVLAGSSRVSEIADCAGASEAASLTPAQQQQAAEIHRKDYPPA
jgi:aryl-alcohol dehydrogenase-like predicted oxidoreductase